MDAVNLLRTGQNTLQRINHTECFPVLGENFLLFELGKSLQAHIKNSLCLCLSQRKLVPEGLASRAPGSVRDEWCGAQDRDYPAHF